MLKNPNQKEHVGHQERKNKDIQKFKQMSYLC